MARKPERISESDLLLPTLRLLAQQPTGYLSTSRLIAALSEEFQPDGEDAEILDNRQDTRFSQIVRNMKSHKDSPRNIVARGFVEVTCRGLRVCPGSSSGITKFSEHEAD